MKKVISIILAVVLITSVFSVTAFADGLRGDANQDGDITAVDARFILQVVAGLKTADDTYYYDMDNSGSITAVDARIVLQIVAGLKEHPDMGQPDTEDKPLDTKEEQLAYFVKSFNDVKVNATAVTHEYNKTYNYNNYVYINLAVEEMYNATLEPGAPSMKEELTAEFSDELVSVNKTYTGSEIATAFPPALNACNLTMNDISDISFKESGEYYLVEVKVKGKTNPKRNESVGNVATIVIKEDFEADMSEEDLEMMSISCDYKEAVATAKIEKATGNMVEYNVDYPMIMVMNVSFLGDVVKIGMGFYDEWSIAY